MLNLRKKKSSIRYSLLKLIESIREVWMKRYYMILSVVFGEHQKKRSDHISESIIEKNFLY